MRYKLYAISCYYKSHRVNCPLCKIYIYVEISFAILIFLIVLDQTFRGGDGKWLQGRMHDSKCDPEGKVILKKKCTTPTIMCCIRLKVLL